MDVIMNTMAIEDYAEVVHKSIFLNWVFKFIIIIGFPSH